MMKSDLARHFSFFIILVAFVAIIVGTYKALQIVNKTQTGTSEGIYTSYVSTSEEIRVKAQALTQTCQSTLCKVQRLLNFTSRIPYHTYTFQKKSPQKTIEENFGDCDDKSNLLISMLHALDIEAYFVLVPKHIFVIVPLNDRRLQRKKGLWINGRKYYILETTAEGSSVGYPLKYPLDQIDVIIEPFSNKKMDIQSIEYKL